MSLVQEAALRYARAGIAVFPVWVRAGDNGDKVVAPIASWRRASTTDENTVRRWFADENASIAIDCGKSHLVVVDCDVTKGVDGRAAWQAIEHEHSIKATWAAATPSGGTHLFYRELPHRVISIDASGKVAPSVDIRGLGGFVIAAPSADFRGAYRWLEGEPEWDALPPAPELIADRLNARKPAEQPSGRAGGADPFTAPGRTFTQPQAEAFIAPSLAELRRARDGSINHTLNAAAKAVSHFVPAFWTAAQAEQMLLDALAHTVYDGKTWKAEATIASAFHSALGDWQAAKVEETTHSEREPPPTAMTARTGRPDLCIGTAADAAEWLRDNIGTGPLAGMFERAGTVVHCPREGEHGYQPPRGNRAGRGNDGDTQIRPLTGPQLAARIQFTYNIFKERKVGGAMVNEPALFPARAAAIAIDAPDMLPHLRPLRGVTHTPLVRADGSILARPGYDPTTQLLHLPDPGVDVGAIPGDPTALDLSRAVKVLEELVADFDFVTDHDRANYFGLMLTPLLRELVPPPYKLGVISAPQPGSGKTLLAGILRTLHGGVLRSEMPEDDAELRKQVTSILDVTTGPVVHFDNVTGILRSSVLAGLLTAPRWDDRKLGANEMISRPNDRLWLLTGNNVTLGGDLLRRAIWVTIDPKTPHPEARTDFRIRDLEGWVREHRGQILHALLVLVRAWVTAGCPTQRRGADGYAAWVETINGILAHAGIAGGFGEAASARQEVGADDDEWADFLTAVHKEFATGSWSVKELLDRVDPGGTDYTGYRPIPLEAVPVELAEKVHRSKTGVCVINKSLGRWLANRAGRWAGQFVVREAGKRENTKIWRVETAGFEVDRGLEVDHQSVNPADVSPGSNPVSGFEGFKGFEIQPTEITDNKQEIEKSERPETNPANPSPNPPNTNPPAETSTGFKPPVKPPDAKPRTSQPCGHWVTASKRECGRTDDTARYLPGWRCPQHAPDREAQP